MPPIYLFYAVAPLVVFVIVDSFANLKWAVAAAIVVALGDIALGYYVLDDVDPGLVVSAALMIGCGYAAVRGQNPLWIKLQPVALSVILAATLFYFQFLSTPLAERYGPVLKAMAAPEQRAQLENPAVIELLNRLFSWCIPLLLVHGAMIAYTALRCSKATWLVTRAFGFYVLLGGLGLVVLMTN